MINTPNFNFKQRIINLISNLSMKKRVLEYTDQAMVLYTRALLDPVFNDLKKRIDKVKDTKEYQQINKEKMMEEIDLMNKEYDKKIRNIVRKISRLDKDLESRNKKIYDDMQNLIRGMEILIGNCELKEFKNKIKNEK